MLLEYTLRRLTAWAATLTKVASARTAAGLLARRLFLAAAVLPILLGSAAIALVDRDYLTWVQGLLLFTITTILAGALVASSAGETVAAMDEGREAAEQARLLLTARLQRYAIELQETVSQRTRELREANASLRATAESNALLALVAQHTISGVVIMDAEGRIQWVNSAFERMCGYDLGELQGRKPSDLLQGPGTAPAALNELREALRRGQPCQLEILAYSKLGRPFWIRVDFQPVRERAGRVVNLVANLTDITAERMHKLQLQQTTDELMLLTERLQLALRSGSFGVWEFDVVRRQRHWDARMFEMHGITEAEFTASDTAWLRTLHPDDAAAVEAQLQRVLDGRSSDYYVEYRVIRPDGEVRHIEALGHLQHDEDRRVVRMVGLTRDRTERKRLEQALELAEQRWQLAIEGTNDSVWDWDMAGGHVYHDERWTRMLGYAPGELTDTVEAWLQLAHPDDLVENATALQEHIAQRTPFYHHELRLRAKDGSWRWILDRGKIVSRSADGRPLRMVGTHSDFTERHELEERLRKSEQMAREVSRLALIGGWEIELPAGRITWTDGTRRIYEVDDTFTPTMDRIWEFYPPESRSTVEAALNDLTPLQPDFDVEVPLRTTTGRRVWTRIIGHADFVDGTAVCVHGAIQDITARHESEAAQRELEAQLFQAQKMETLGTLAGGIAHDFNNLLTGILGYHELATESLPGDHPARECLAEARNASLRARELVEQILTFGRQPNHATHVPVDITRVLGDARRFLRATLPANISIDVECAAPCSPILGDATQIHQVILNLGSNAAHAMRRHGGTLSIKAEPADVTPELALTLGGPAAASYVRLTVSDTGHGMDEGTRRRIFDPFFTTKNTREGTGLGLAVVHGIVRAHRAIIDVQSTPGRGSTFRVYFPTATEAAVQKDVSPSVPHGAGEFVCVVDDEEVVGSCTKMVLENHGYRSLTFRSAEKCLDRLGGSVDLCSVLVTDQTMPGMQGTELAVALRKLKPDLPIVIMSGYFSKISAHALDELGQVELLAKPFTTDELANAVHRALHPTARAA